MTQINNENEQNDNSNKSHKDYRNNIDDTNNKDDKNPTDFSASERLFSLKMTCMKVHKVMKENVKNHPVEHLILLTLAKVIGNN